MSLAIDASTVSVFVASVSVIVGAVYYMYDTRHQQVMRQTESILRLSPWFSMSAREMQEAISQVCSVEYTDYSDYLTKYAGKPEQISLKLLGNYFEGLGLLVYRHLVEPKIMFDFWGDLVQSIWNDNEALIIAMRKDSNTPEMFKFWEYLSKEFRKRKLARHVLSIAPKAIADLKTKRI
jgi:hypothetical protein